MVFNEFAITMEHYDEQVLLKSCLRQIEEKLGWGSADSWHNEVFTELSETIHQSTQILLSVTTLKRVWGKVNYTNAPSITTLNALAQFAGYANWRDFKTQANEHHRQEEPPGNTANNRRIVFVSASLLTVLFILLFSMVGIKPQRPVKIDAQKIRFSSRPVVQGLPNSVVFDVDLHTIDSDSIYIQQFWDVTKTIKLHSDQKQATGIYYFPGYFRSKLLVDGQILKEHDLFIKSNGWMATIDYEPVPKYIDLELQENKLAIPDQALEEIKSSNTPLVSSFHYVDDFNDVSGDNIMLNCAVRNVYHDKWAVCQTLRMVILGAEGAIIIPFSIPGCVSDIGLMLNDVYLSGKQHDLSAFGVDLSDYRDVQTIIKNKAVLVAVDGQVVYEGNYHKTIGKLVGIRFRFLGAGEVGYFNLVAVGEENSIAKEGFYITGVK